ncbi:hypothetical protein K7711_19165 [Nocardia sp. CA2R105]|uniref:hypothetical protein n=1 Tax=Nocardia coffeae TaxID=2873381 RepID=UPI001CA66BB6|nr:hypothetical protein [Nocardia coffeae]MBY8858607.1 hypothetical protein [Nocardia coffeae]
MNPALFTSTAAMPDAKTQLPDTVCNLPDIVGTVCKGLRLGGQAADAAVSSAFDSFVQSLIKGMGILLRYDLTWWTDLPSPTLAAPTGEPGPALASIRGYTSGLQVLLLTAGIMFAAARLALAKRGGVAGEAQEAFLMFARAVFASMTFAAVVTVGTRAGDAFSNWVIFDATRGDSNNAAELLNGISQTDAGLGTGVVLIIGLFGLISMLVQLVMLVVRQAFLILVVAALPIAAAAAGTGPGSQAYKRMLSWSLAFLLWKPVGALCYAIAFSAAGAKSNTQHQDPQMVLLGLILLLMVAVVLPALMRLIAPVVATMGGGSGAAATLAGGLAGVAMGSAGGDRSEARKVTENDSGAGGGGNPSAPSGGLPPPGGPSGGGRPMGGGTAGGGTDGAGTSGGTGAAAPTESNAAAPSASGAGAAGGGAAGGAAGVAVTAARSAHDGVQQAGSSAAPAARDTAESGVDPDALGPMEVRR